MDKDTVQKIMGSIGEIEEITADESVYGIITEQLEDIAKRVDEKDLVKMMKLLQVAYMGGQKTQMGKMLIMLAKLRGEIDQKK